MRSAVLARTEDFEGPTGNEDSREDASGKLGTCKEEDENKETCVDETWHTSAYGNVAGNAVTWVDTTGRV